MRPVNLLPERYRPAKSSGKRSGSAYVLLGVLGALLLVVFLFVNTSNQVADREQKTAAAQAEAQQAEAQAGTLGAYGDFKAAKETRTQSVGSIANGRFDWERFCASWHGCCRPRSASVQPRRPPPVTRRQPVLPGRQPGPRPPSRAAP